MPNTKIDPKPRRSKYIIFTFVWQVLMVALFIAALTAGTIEFLAGDADWIPLSINALTFAIFFVTAFWWRSTERILIAARATRRGTK